MKILTIKKRYPLVILLAIVFITTISMHLGVLINVTPSMKRGLYIRAYSPIQRGDIVAVCLPEPYKSEGLARHYLDTGTQCKGALSLIKEIIGVPGDTIILKDEILAVNGKAYDYPTAYFDKANRPLTVFPRGEYQQTTGYWFIGTFAKNSWDSRYWGPLHKSQVLYKLHPLVLFD